MPGLIEVVPSLKPLDVMHQEVEVGDSSTSSWGPKLPILLGECLCFHGELQILML